MSGVIVRFFKKSLLKSYFKSLRIASSVISVSSLFCASTPRSKKISVYVYRSQMKHSSRSDSFQAFIESDSKNLVFGFLSFFGF